MHTSAENERAVARSKVTVPRLQEMKVAGEKIAMLTAYAASFSAHCEAGGIDIVLWATHSE